ncbi:uncharacterized protein B0H64DRAFT_78777 [Chaetomium fimeti]|uniref:Uncharacterized protein n=1 Tax=Chaetomium fimeti TaxID=1854472 RepID=A0AAE0HL66_9PEZI|nr:hypothetical protein B0H64DRAFT_78777 [Chaetomium fimeti]
MSFIEGWNQKPFATLTLSVSGVLALADLHGIAERTVITGGASWIDILLLAPGIHYQQAADDLFRRGGGAASVVDVVDEFEGSAVTFKLNNAATATYIQSVAKPGETVTLDVGRAIEGRGRYKLHRSESGDEATAWKEGKPPGRGMVSHALYLAGPILTLAAIVFIVIFKDWWALILIFALMVSRLLNIWVIKQRAAESNNNSKDGQRASPDSGKGSSRSQSTTRSSGRGPGQGQGPAAAAAGNGPERHRRLSISATRQRISQFLVRLNDAEHRTLVRLRGKAADIRDITARSWLRRKTQVEGYLEAIAKLIVYLVAALSGNMTQTGSLIMMTLLLVTAGMLALSNASAKKLVVNGVEVGVAADGADKKGGAAGGGNGNGNGRGGLPPSVVALQGGRGRPRRDNGGATAAVVDPREGRAAAGPSGMRGGGNPADLAERGQVGQPGHVRFKK